MDRKHPAWTLLCVLVVFPAVLGAAENVTGKLIFYQMEGNAVYVRDTGELASGVATETMFELFDPLKHLSSAEFTYTWDLGNGEVIHGTEPVVRYHYSESGNYTLRLNVAATVSRAAPPITRVYSMDVRVLDTIKTIELKEPLDYKVSQESSLDFHVDGSPPMWMCWRFLANCEPDMTVGCTLAVLHENTLQLNHTFTSAGVHCLDVGVRNDISNMRTSFSLYVRRDNPSHLLFILSCSALLVATFSFIVIIACRPRLQRRSQVSASSNSMFLKELTSQSQNKTHLNFSTMERGEKVPLVFQQGTQNWF